MERKQRVPHLHSLGGYGLISNAKETQPTTFLIFNVAGKCEKSWTLPKSMLLHGVIMGVLSQLQMDVQITGPAICWNENEIEALSRFIRTG